MSSFTWGGERQLQWQCHSCPAVWVTSDRRALNGVRLSAVVPNLTGANRNDSQEALALVDAIPPLQGERCRPRRRGD